MKRESFRINSNVVYYLVFNAYLFIILSVIVMGKRETRIADKSILKSSDLIDAKELSVAKAVNKYVNSVTAYVGSIADDLDVGSIVIGVKQATANSGYYGEVSSILNSGFSEQTNLSAQLYKNLYGENYFFSDGSLIAMNQLKTISLLQSNAVGDAFATKVVQAIAGGSEKQVILRQINNQFGKELFNQAKTIINTSTNAAYTEANVLLAEDAGITHFEYSGSLIATSRPFCVEHLGEVRTTDEWNELDNGQIGPVSIYLGGWNCRHSFFGVFDESDSLNTKKEIKDNQRLVDSKKEFRKLVKDAS